MERLTARNKNGEAYYPQCYCKDGCDGFGGDCSNCKFNDGVCEMLAAYEDTCLTPDQLRQIRIWYEELATELARMRYSTYSTWTATTRAGRMRWSLSREQSRR